MRRWPRVFLLLTLIAGCDRDKSVPGAASAAPAGPLPKVAECEAYFQKARECGTTLLPEEKKELEADVSRFENQLRHAASSAAALKSVAIGCQTELESLGHDCGRGEAEEEEE